MEHAGELAHGEPVIGWEVTHILAVVNYGKPSGFVSYLPGGEVHSEVSFKALHCNVD